MDTWIGTVISVRGALVDVGFKGQTLPPINTALAVQWERPEPLVLEVHSHVDSVTVRGIALQATAGLARNSASDRRSHLRTRWRSGPGQAPGCRGRSVRSRTR